MAFMDVLLRRYPGRFAWFSLRGEAKPEHNPWQVAYASSPLPKNISRLPGLLRFLNYRVFPYLQAHRATKFAREQGCQVVLADLAFETVIVGRLAAKRLGVPLLVNVHDDPVERLRLKKLPKTFLRWYERQFEKTLRAAQRVGVISDYMGEAYQQRYGVQTTTLYIGVEAEKCLAPRCPDPSGDCVIITLGSQNSSQNWVLLIAAVKQLNSWTGRQKFRILHIGDLSNDLPRSAEVEVTSWLPEEGFLRQLERADICFLNSSFDSYNAEVGRLSFPLKVHSYILAQRPILALGPEDSAVVRFVRDHQAGTVCTQSELAGDRFAGARDDGRYGSDLASVIQSLSTDSAQCVSALAGLARLRETFNRELFFETFESFIVDVADHSKIGVMS